MAVKPRTERVADMMVTEAQEILSGNPTPADIGRASDLLTYLLGYLSVRQAPDEVIQESLTERVNELAAQDDEGLAVPIGIYRELVAWHSLWESDPDAFRETCHDSAFEDLFSAIAFTAERISNLAAFWMHGNTYGAEAAKTDATLKRAGELRPGRAVQ